MRSNNKLAAFWVAAVATALLYLIARDMSSPPTLIVALATPAYPAAIIFGAGAVALTFMRLRVFNNSGGNVSLLRTGAAVLTAVAVVFVAYNRGGTVTHHLCEFIVLWFVGAYTFVVIVRSSHIAA